MFEREKAISLIKKIKKCSEKYIVDTSYLDIFNIPLPKDIDYTKPVLVFWHENPCFIYKEPAWHIYIGFSSIYYDNVSNEWYETEIDSNILKKDVNNVPEPIRKKFFKLILENKNEYIKLTEKWKVDYIELETKKFGENYGKKHC